MLQPVILDKNGTHRFKENAIVNMLITGTSQSDSYLNNICFYLHDNHTQQTIDEQRHLYQLIGYSVSGYGDLQIVCEDGTYDTDTGEHLLIVDKIKVSESDIDHPICDIQYVDGKCIFVGNETLKWVVAQRGTDINAIICDTRFTLSDKRQFLQLLGLTFDEYFMYGVNRFISDEDGYHINVMDMSHYKELIDYCLNNMEN